MKLKRTFHFTGTTMPPVELCGGGILHQLKVDGVFEIPFEVPPTEGKHDFNTCDECQKSLIVVTNCLKEDFEGQLEKKAFPYCCESHTKLLKLKHFNLADFVQVPAMVARKVIYTNQHIINNHSNDNWQKIICDYIDLMVESFGQFPNGFGGQLYLHEYFDYVKQVLEDRKEIPKEKKLTLTDYLESFTKPQINSESPDLKALINTYKKWLNEFPFQLSPYFGELKQHYEALNPILNGKPNVNAFTGVSVSKLHTQTSLVNSLIKLTKDLLGKVDARQLVEKEIIADISQHRFELESESLRIASDEITKEFTSGELEYVSLLSKWLELHKVYFKEIAGLIKKTASPEETETQSKKLQRCISEFGFFELPKVMALTSANQEKLLNTMVEFDVPYRIAMFDYLGFIKYLSTQHFTSKTKLNKEVAVWLETTARTIKGNLGVLSNISKENRTRYTAHLHKETVSMHYQSLK